MHRDLVAVSFYNSEDSSGSYCDCLSCNIELDSGKITKREGDGFYKLKCSQIDTIFLPICRIPIISYHFSYVPLNAAIICYKHSRKRERERKTRKPCI